MKKEMTIGTRYNTPSPIAKLHKPTLDVNLTLHIWKCFFNFFFWVKIIEDMNPWGPLWKVIVENIPLFQDQFFELFSVQVMIQEWRHCECKPPFMTWLMCHVVLYVFQYLLVRVATLKAQTLPLSLNVLMLCGNMEQLAKLMVSIFALLAWTDCSREFIIIIKHKKCLNFFDYFKMHFEMCILK